MGILRILLALAVVVAHAGSLFGYAPFEPAAAVQCFYVISGFYMALVLDQAYAPGVAGVTKFYISRYLRLAPTYWVVLLGTLAGAIVIRRLVYLSWADLKPLLAAMNWRTLVGVALANLLIVGQDVLLFTAFDPASGHLYWTASFLAEPYPTFKFLLVPQAWSLGVELLFYLVAPFILRRKTIVLVVILALSVGARILLMANGHGDDPWKYRFFPTELAVFLCGSLAYRTYRHGVAVASSRVAKVLLAGIVALLLSYQFIHIPEIAKRFSMVVLIACALPSIFALTRRSKRDNYIGKLSYPIYVSHVMLLGVVRAGPLRVPVLVLLSVLVAALLVHFVEDRVDVWRSRLRSTART